MNKLYVCFYLLLSMSCFNNQPIKDIDMTVVKKVDFNRYIGKWYEIARFPNSFEKNLVGVTATYSFRKDGKIQVQNTGLKNNLDGKLEKAVGKAKIPDPAEPGKLKVSFFLFFYADYFIFELDEENYQYALIGSSSDNYLWILSRTPQMSSDVYNLLLEKAAKRGYDTSRLVKVEQKKE